MPYIISSQSVTDGVSLSVSKSKLVYSSLIFLVSLYFCRVIYSLEADLWLGTKPKTKVKAKR